MTDEPTEFEIAQRAREMKAEYDAMMGEGAVQPDFIESAKMALKKEQQNDR
jgi:hypothetical protein